ncbi:hypothetical protein P280DRAFT_546125 [Massarina eburnea CBS 473.64]|uniref:Uncharacterized protein n=1 Tax=Massarina eburnea CBS 473.64 TaxID=1395130 RepID=A0A6A6SDA3_9PLEO|nr:hypothetical protein P280DRAFT_546125 [Massarina eburnea CBS 473.64]
MDDVTDAESTSHTPFWNMAKEASLYHLRQHRVDEDAVTSLWNKTLRKANTILEMMQVSDYEAGHYFDPPRDTAASTFTDTTNPVDHNYKPHDLSWELDLRANDNSKALCSLGIGTHSYHCGGYNFSYLWDHGGHYKNQHGMFEYGFKQVLNPYAGAIVAVENCSPAYFSDDDYPVSALHFWSDVAFLQYRTACVQYERMFKQPAADLKYILRQSIVNDDTCLLVGELFEKSKQKLTRWPGVEFPADSVGGKILLGCPNGAGVGFMLVQHKAQLGIKCVKNIRLFLDRSGLLNLLFVLENVD